jgi:hypothetical protein
MTKSSFKKTKKKDYDLSPSGNGNTLKAEFIGNTNKVIVRVVDQTCLDRLLMNDSISLDQYKSVDVLFSEFQQSRYDWCKSHKLIILELQLHTIKMGIDKLF